MANRTFRISVGDLVGKSFAIYFRNLIPFTVISILTLSPWIALQLLAKPELGNEPSYTATRSVLMFQGSALLLQSLLSFMTTAAITFGVVQQLRGQPAGLASALVQGLQSFGRVFVTSLLCGLRIILFTLLLFIPGIIEQLRLYVALPVAVMEGKSASDAVRRSIQLTDGSRWNLFAALVLLFVIAMVLGIVFGVVAVMLNREFDTERSPWFDIATQVLVTPFGATMAATAYFLLRMGKENVDVKELAAVFD